MHNQSIIPVMGITTADFTNIIPPKSSWEAPFKGDTQITINLKDGLRKIVSAEKLDTPNDPDEVYYLIKNPNPSIKEGNHYLIINRGKSVGAYPKPSHAREWAKKIGEYE